MTIAITGATGQLGLWPDRRTSHSLHASPDDLREIDDDASQITVQGARLPEAVLKLSNPLSFDCGHWGPA